MIGHWYTSVASWKCSVIQHTPPGTPCAMQPPHNPMGNPKGSLAAKAAGGCRARHACTVQACTSGWCTQPAATAWRCRLPVLYACIKSPQPPQLRHAAWQATTPQLCLLRLCRGQSRCLHLEQWHMPCPQYWNPQPRRVSITPAVCSEPATLNPSSTCQSRQPWRSVNAVPHCAMQPPHPSHHCLSTSTSPQPTRPPQVVDTSSHCGRQPCQHPAMPRLLVVCSPAPAASY
jgi:hypothetical protein